MLPVTANVFCGLKAAKSCGDTDLFEHVLKIAGLKSDRDHVQSLNREEGELAGYLVYRQALTENFAKFLDLG